MKTRGFIIEGKTGKDFFSERIFNIFCSKNSKNGFTLIELLIVIGIIAILAGAVVIAVSPGERLASARDATRERHMNAIKNAIYSYVIDNGTYPGEISGNLTEICNSSLEDPDCNDFVDLSALVPQYMSVMPIDPSKQGDEKGIGYAVALEEDKIIARATKMETFHQPTYYASFDNNLTFLETATFNTISPEEGYVATIRPQQGRFGGAAAVEGSTHNILADEETDLSFSYFEENLPIIGERDQIDEGWRFHLYPNEDINPETAVYWDTIEDTFRIEQRPGGNSETQVEKSIGKELDPEKTYTVSVRVKTTTPVTARLHFRMMVDGQSSWGWASNYHSGSGEWETVSSTFTGVEKIRTMRFQLTGANETSTSWWKNPQIEEGSFPTSFVEGSREEGVVKYPISILNHKEGAMSFWFKIPHGFPSDKQEIWMSTSGSYSSSHSLNFASNSSFPDRVLGYHWSTPDGEGYNHRVWEYDVENYIDQEWNHHVITWNKDSGYSVYLNGEFLVDRGSDLPLRDFMDNYFTILGDGVVLYDDFAIFDYEVTEKEAKRWFEKNRPLY